MKLNVYAVRDSKTASYGNPQCFVNDGHAVRTYTDITNRAEEGNLFRSHPEDFEIFHLGAFDTDTAEISTGAPRSVMRLEELIKTGNGA